MQRSTSFYYATGAAYCISSAIMPQLEKYIRSDLTHTSIIPSNFLSAL